MGLKRQIETLKEWACEKANYGSVCPFDMAFQAIEDRAKEGAGND